MPFSTESSAFQWPSTRSTKAISTENEKKPGGGKLIDKLFGRTKSGGKETQEESGEPDVYRETEKFQEKLATVEHQEYQEPQKSQGIQQYPELYPQYQLDLETEDAQIDDTHTEPIDLTSGQFVAQRIVGMGLSLGEASYLRPLEMKMAPRNDSDFHLARPPSTCPSDMMHPVTKARHRGETHAILNGRGSDEPVEFNGDFRIPGTPQVEENDGEGFHVPSDQQINHVAVMASAYGHDAERWTNWMNSYVKVRCSSNRRCAKDLQFVYRANSVSTIFLRLLHLLLHSNISRQSFLQTSPTECKLQSVTTLSGLTLTLRPERTLATLCSKQ